MTSLAEIDPAPFQYKTTKAEAALVQAQQQADTLKANYQQATANVEGATAELTFKKQRLADRKAGRRRRRYAIRGARFAR